MKLSDLYGALKTVCSNVAYREFVTPVEPPFICYLFTRSDDLMADDVNFLDISEFDIELYTDKKDPSLEASLEDALRSLGLTWTREETSVESEHLNEVVYSVPVIGISDESDDSS